MILAFLALATVQDDLQPVVDKVNAKLQAARSLTMTIKTSSNKGPEVQSWSVKALRPNYFSVESENQLFMSDGQTVWQLMRKQNRYNRLHPADKKGMSIPLANGFQGFSPPSNYKALYDGIERTTFNGRDAFALVKKPKEVPNLELRVFIDRQTYLPIGAEQKSLDSVQTNVYEDLRLDADLKMTDFVFSPPDGAVDADATKVELPYPKAGEPAPDFEVELISGKKAKLSDLLKRSKGVVLNFWFIECNYCQMEMPHLDEMYKKLKSKGLEMVVVNDADTAENIRKFIKGSKYDFPAATDSGAVAAKAYKVANGPHPVTFLIEPSGKIAYMQMGFDVKNGLKLLSEAVRKLGIK
jgi:peroxiredoxin/outer membrane lipoprotein-sorting protein